MFWNFFELPTILFKFKNVKHQKTYEMAIFTKFQTLNFSGVSGIPASSSRENVKSISTLPPPPPALSYHQTPQQPQLLHHHNNHLGYQNGIHQVCDFLLKILKK